MGVGSSRVIPGECGYPWRQNNYFSALSIGRRSCGVLDTEKDKWRGMGARKTSHVRVAAAVFALSTLPLELALSADSNTAITVDIEALPLETALIELCKQGHLQLVISTGYLPVRMSAPLRGNIALGAALDYLLEDTGLTYKLV